MLEFGGVVIEQVVVVASILKLHLVREGSSSLYEIRPSDPQYLPIL